MTRNRARRARRSFMALALAGIGQFGCGPAMAEPPGLALVIGVDRDASQAGGGVCGPAARGLRDRLSAQGLAVQAVLNPARRLGRRGGAPPVPAPAPRGGGRPR